MSSHRVKLQCTAHEYKMLGDGKFGSGCIEISKLIGGKKLPTYSTKCCSDGGTVFLRYKVNC